MTRGRDHFFWNSIRALQSFAICLSSFIEFKPRFEHVCKFGKVSLSNTDIIPCHKEKVVQKSIFYLIYNTKTHSCRVGSAPKLAPRGKIVLLDVDWREFGKIRLLQRGIVPATCRLLVRKHFTELLKSYGG